MQYIALEKDRILQRKESNHTARYVALYKQRSLGYLNSSTLMANVTSQSPIAQSPINTVSGLHKPPPPLL